MRSLLIGLFFLAASPVRADTFAVTILAVDALDRPVAKADAATLWAMHNGALLPVQSAGVTGADGRVALRIEDSNEVRPVLVLSADRSLGAVVPASRADDGKERRVVLAPTIKVKAVFDCPDLGHRPAGAIISVNPEAHRRAFVTASTTTGEFSMVLPAGQYRMWQRGTDLEGKFDQPLDLDGTRSEVDLGTIAFAAAPIAKLRGKPAPDLAVTAVRNVAGAVKLADHKGKWVVLDFWGYWCGPCVAASIPEAIAFQETHAEHADRFVILAVHDNAAKSAAELDARMPGLRERYWAGKPPPFPVVLDAKNETIERYGINRYPTMLLIDPEGKLVGEASFADLAKKFPPVPAAKLWAAHRDRHDNPAEWLEPTTLAWADLAKNLTRVTHCESEIDAAAITAAGLNPKGGLPVAGAGSVASLRSFVELCLEPHGLGVVPSADGKKLVVTKCHPIGGTPSALQAFANRELAARLDRHATFREHLVTKPLAIDGVPLLDAAKLIHREYDVSVAFDPRAIAAKTLEPAAKVVAKFGPGDLGAGLSAMLAPLGLRYEVRCEVVWITAK